MTDDKVSMIELGFPFGIAAKGTTFMRIMVGKGF